MHGQPHIRLVDSLSRTKGSVLIHLTMTLFSDLISISKPMSKSLSLFHRTIYFLKRCPKCKKLSLWCGEEVHRRWIGVDGQLYTPAALSPEKRPGSHCTGSCVGPRVGLDGCRESLPRLGFDPRSFQTVVIRYTDWTIRAVHYHNIQAYICYYGRSWWPCFIAGITGSNLCEGMDVCLLWLLFVVQTAASATDWSLVHRSSNVCICVCLFVYMCVCLFVYMCVC